MGRFDDVNEEKVTETIVPPAQKDDRFRLISTLISTPDVLSEGDRKYRALEKLIRTDFLKLTATVGIPGESAIYAELLTLLADLHELVEFPYLANKNVLAVGGEFSAGKSRFLNAVFGVDNLLPTDPNPTTAIPTYLTYSEQERILSLNTFNRSQLLSREELNAISHGFNANQSDADSRISFYHILRLLQVQSPDMKWKNIAFLDTPGYSKPKESVEDEEAAKGTDAGNTDEEKAREHLSTADYLIWVVSAADGTFQQPGIVFLRDKVKWNKPLYLLVNKADQPTSSDLPAIFKQICNDVRNAGFNVAGASAYSSRERKVYLGDDPADWFKAIDGKLKLTKWRGRFKAITEKVIRYCDGVQTHCADYERMLKRLELEPDLEDALSAKVKELRKGISEECRKRKVAVEQFTAFSDKVEKGIDGLLRAIGVEEEKAADVGLVAVGSGTDLIKLKKGEKIIGTVEVISQFSGCFIVAPQIKQQIHIKYKDIEAVYTEPKATFAKGRNVELTVYEVKFGENSVVFTARPLI